MENCWVLSTHKLWLYWSLMLMMMHIFMVGQAHGYCIEEERKALLEIKASYIKLYDSKVDNFLPTWDDYGGDCCDWERIYCNTTTHHVTQLSLYLLRGVTDDTVEYWNKLWPLNISLFLHFKELTSLNLSYNFLDNEVMKTGLEKLSSLNKLEVLDLSFNDDININDIVPSLRTLTSLKILDLSYTSFNENFPINEFAALENLEELDISHCYSNGTFEIHGFERVSIFRKLKTLNLAGSRFNESIISYLTTLSSLTNLDLSYNPLSGPFPAQELAHLTKLEKLDLSFTQLNSAPDIQACKSLSRLKRLASLDLSYNEFNKSILSCLTSLPSLKILDLSRSLGSSFPFQEFHNLPDLEVVLLTLNGFNETLPVEAFASFHQLKVLDLSWNHFVGSIPSAIQALSSLRALSFANNYLNGSLPDHGFCELKNLLELDLSGNMLDGILPQCFNSLSSLKLFDISSNRFTGTLVPSLVANLRSLEYIDFSHNKFEGSFPFSSFSNHINLELVRFRSDNDKFEVETEEPMDWIPMFQLKVLVLSNCNMNRHKRRVIPGFLLHQRKLQEVEMSHNQLEGQFPSWLIENNTNLEVLNLRNNFFSGKLLLNRNANMLELDMSRNQLIGTIPDNIQTFFPYIRHLNLSKNALTGAVPSSVGDLRVLGVLDLSDNDLFGEVPKGLLSNISSLEFLKLSKNRFHGELLSGNLSLGYIQVLHLDSNCFTGVIANETGKHNTLMILDISNNFFTGMIPGWISNTSKLSELVVRNNSLEGRFPCGEASYSFLDISQNSFSGPIPSCLNLQYMEHLFLGSNRFTGSTPHYFCNLTGVLTLDISNNNLSGRIPKFLGELSTLRILLLRKNNFSGSIPKQLCQLRDVSLLDLSNNSLAGSIPSCLKNITGPSDLIYFKRSRAWYPTVSSYAYKNVLWRWQPPYVNNEGFEMQDEVQFTTKTLFLPYKGDILDYMTGFDLSCNKLTGEIPEELGFLTHIHALNLSHNQLMGSIPVSFSNLAMIESMDLSSNGLTGRIPLELIKLTSLSVFNVSHNDLSGRLPDMKAQFGTFTEASYKGNPLLCGPPLENKCTTNTEVNNLSVEEDNEKWYDVDMACFYGSSSSTCVVFLLGFVALLYTNPQWRRRWLDWVEDYMFTCYYFLYDLVSNLLFKPFHT